MKVFTDIAPKGFKCRRAINSGNIITGLPNTGAYILRGLKRTPVIVGIKKKRTPRVTTVLIMTT